MALNKIGFVLLVFALSVTNARVFNNPVLDGGNYPDPGVIKVGDIYYAVTTTNNDENEKFPIHKSTDLQNWELVGYVFNQDNFPSWSSTNVEFWAPEIHQVGDEFRLYFTARVTDKDVLGLGVASAKQPEGPYTPQDEPLLWDPAMWETDPTLIKLNGSLILCWVGTANSWIRIRNLTDDGLAFKDNITTLLFNFDLPWEWERTEGPWYIFRNGYHYIFYSANNYCSNDYVLSVARSKDSVAGPYEKIGYPLLQSDDRFISPGHGSIVRDVDGEGWVFVHHGYKKGAVCGDNYRLMFATSMEWGDDDWPKIMHMT